MKKIQKIINNCQECEFSLIYERTQNQALICGGIQVDKETKSEAFLILIADKVSHYISKIPNNCPLENYEPKTDC